jgi:hypothetical protein
LAKELDPRFRSDERVATAFDPFVVRAFLTIFFFAVFFAMQIALSASGFGV